jgi:photosystem II stability/assembly factor-like uncharacterized protein
MIFSHSILFAQSWKCLGGPGGLFSEDIVFLRSGRLISTADQGVYISNNYGNTWQSKPVDSLCGVIYSLQERTNGNLMAITSKGIAQSSDSGESWLLCYSYSGLHDSGSFVVESPVDSALYYGTCHSLNKSTTNGKMWTSVWTGAGLSSYAINDSGWIFLGVDSLGLFCSTDSGKSFNAYPIGFSFSTYRVVKILTTHNNGLYVKVTGPTNQILFYEYRNLSRITTPLAMLGVTEFGDVIFVGNTELYLYNHSTRMEAILSSPSFFKEHLEQEAITHGSTWVINAGIFGLYRSTNSGKTWTEINTGLGLRQCLSILVTDDYKIYAGVYKYIFWGGLYVSPNGGASWEDLNPLNYWAYYVAIDLLNNGNIAASGSYGTMIYDIKKGIWSKIPYNSLCYSGYVSRNGTIYMCDDYKGVCVSTDNGNSWYWDQNLTYVMGFGESSTGRIFAGTWYGQSFYSDDQGNNWQLISSSWMCYNSAYDFIAMNDTLFAGTDIGLLISTDNGINWKYQYSSPAPIKKLIIAPNGDLLAAIPVTGIYRTSDRGITWSTMNEGLGNTTVNDFAIDNSNIIYVATNKGIYTTDWYNKLCGKKVFACTLNPNFPNPFNPKTTISFDLLAASVVTLKVYNILGKEVAELCEDKYFDAGHKYIDWDASKFASGVYFCRIQIGSYSHCQKMILLK